MKILRTKYDLNQFRADNLNKKLGFVPTMGNLHDGHISLISEAQKHVDVVIISSYINPTQFGENEDLEAYPRTFDSDVEKCQDAKVDAIFLPTSNLIYPHGIKASPIIDIPSQMRTLCAKSRPTHFQGVATVVLKLFQLIQPHTAVFGKKDFQQLAIIRRLVSEFFLDINIIGSQIIREADGLAMSSRNQYLSDEERIQAGQINIILADFRKNLKNESTDSAINKARQELTKTKGKIEYLELIDKDTLAPINDIENSIIVTAIKIGKTHLLDNLEI